MIKDWPQVGLTQNGSSTYIITPTPTHIRVIELGKPCTSCRDSEVIKLITHSLISLIIFLVFL